MPEIITSTHNQNIKDLLLLQQKSQARKKARCFVVEGRRELQHCLEAGYEVEKAFVCSSLLNGNRQEDDWSAARLLTEINATHIIYIDENVYDKIAYRGSTEGIVAVVRMKDHSLDTLSLSAAPLVLVLEGVEKPGNLGAILRSADAAGADAVIVCDPLTDLYNPNLIRSSIGAAFTVPVAVCSSQECIAYLQERQFAILTAQLQDSLPYYDTPMTGPTAIVMGTEATGLTNVWREAATAHIRIPMLGRMDSLNVSVSAAVLLYEALRQRQDKLPL